MKFPNVATHRYRMTTQIPWTPAPLWRARPRGSAVPSGTCTVSRTPRTSTAPSCSCVDRRPCACGRGWPWQRRGRICRSSLSGRCPHRLRRTRRMMTRTMRRRTIWRRGPRTCLKLYGNEGGKKKKKKYEKMLT